ncbi:MAG: hypothetical protein LBI48_12810 [Burkholderiaceae bacterium]|jgi:hypothetical protein|nr:hypothetical protein [Burkholderiaceae bacterium]
MSKGIASQNSLKALAYPVRQFLAAWGAAQRLAPIAAGAQLPPPYALAAVRGEGVLRERFFGHFIARLPVQLDAAQQLTLWSRLVENGGHITAWVQRLGVAAALRREAALPEQAQQQARQLYTLLLHALAQEQPQLLPSAADGFFHHLWRQQFPAQAAAPQDKAQPKDQVLRERLARALRKRHGKAVTVRESFQQQSDQVRFALLMKTPPDPHWKTLVQLERPRLKTARRAAYDAALDAMLAEHRLG